MSDIFEFEDKARVERLVGTLHDPAATPGDVLTVQPDGSIKAVAGPTPDAPVQGRYSGNAVSIADGFNLALTFDTLVGGTELLNRANPGNPSFLAAGTYALSVVVVGDALTAAGYACITTNVPAGIAAVNQTPNPENGSSASCAFIAAAGNGILVSVLNADGVSARNFHLALAVLVKLA